MKRLAILLALAMVAGLAQGAVYTFTEDFSGYTNGQVIGGPDWNAKWSADTTNWTYPQLELWTGDNGAARLDTSGTLNNYHIVNKGGGFVVGDNQYATITSDFKIEMITQTLLDFNEPFIAMRVSNSSNWWEGAGSSATMCNRGGAWGTRLPYSPWITGWNSWGALGLVNGQTAGVSDWFKIEMTIVPGPSNYLGQAKWMNMAEDTTYYVRDQVDLGITNGSVIYGGFTTDYNGKNGTSNEFTTMICQNVTNVWMDNFIVEVNNNPTEWTILSDDFEAVAYQSTNGYEIPAGNSWWIQDWKGKTDPWNQALNNPQAFIVTNEVLSGPVTNHYMAKWNGWRGIASTTHPFDIAESELAIIEFDLRFDLGPARINATFVDVCLVPEETGAFTNNPPVMWQPAGIWYDTPGSGREGLSRRLRYTEWQGASGLETNGSFIIDMWNGVSEWYDPAILGVEGGTGTNWYSDECRFTFRYQKGFNGLWESITTISNLTTAATVASTQNVTSVSASDSPDLILCIQSEAANTHYGIDNVVGKRALGPALVPKGYDAWALDYDLAGSIYDDDDLDGVINLYEYGYDGDPTNSGDLGTLPVMEIDGGGANVDVLKYQTLSSADAGISYHATYNTNLYFPWSGAWDSYTNYPNTLKLNEQKREIDASTTDQMFMKVLITRP